jgi:hypothetical protein
MQVTVARHQPFKASQVQIYARIARLQQFDSIVMQQPNCHSERNEEAVFAWNRENAAMNRRPRARNDNGRD